MSLIIKSCAIKKFRLLVLSLILFCNSANAVFLKNLYHIEYDVKDNSAATRNEILPIAFEQMLLKVASSKVTLEHSELAVAKQNIDKYVNSFSYEQIDGSYKLNVQFNEKMVAQLLNSMAKPVLGKNRPTVLVWLNDMGVTHAELQSKLDALSKNYGIPMVVPVLDLPDVDLRPDQVQELIKRHRADIVLKGSRTDWQLLDGKEDSTWSNSSQNTDEQLEAMLNTLAQRLYLRYGQAAQTKDSIEAELQLRVLGIKNMQDYTRITAYLKNISQIKKVSVNSVLEDEASFTLVTERNIQDLAALLANDQTLIAEVTNVSEDNKQISCRTNL